MSAFKKFESHLLQIVVSSDRRNKHELADLKPNQWLNGTQWFAHFVYHWFQIKYCYCRYGERWMKKAFIEKPQRWKLIYKTKRSLKCALKNTSLWSIKKTKNTQIKCLFYASCLNDTISDLEPQFTVCYCNSRPTSFTGARRWFLHPIQAAWLRFDSFTNCSQTNTNSILVIVFYLFIWSFNLIDPEMMHILFAIL